MMVLTLLFLLLQSLFVFAFDIDSKSNVAVYWGQASAGSQESLATYCQSDDVDIVLLSFLYQYPSSVGLNFASACTSTFSDGLLHCSTIGEDIQTCQSLGKKVFLSLGGAAGSYGFSNDEEAETFATTLWNTFGEGSGKEERPFDDALIDGFDFDIENNNPTGYTALVKKLRNYFSSGSKNYYISAAPQCFYPDSSVGELLSNGDVDFAFVQFYNNYCNVDKQFNWDTWLNFAQTISPNSNIKLYLGLPGSATAAGSGYISDLETIKTTVQTISGSENFGGIMLWDASQGFDNKVDGVAYIAHMKNILKGSGNVKSSEVSSAISTKTATSRAAASSVVFITASSHTSSGMVGTTSSLQSVFSETSTSTHDGAVTSTTSTTPSTTIPEIISTTSTTSAATIPEIIPTFSTSEIASTLDASKTASASSTSTTYYTTSSEATSFNPAPASTTIASSERFDTLSTPSTYLDISSATSSSKIVPQESETTPTTTVNPLVTSSVQSTTELPTPQASEVATITDQKASSSEVFAVSTATSPSSSSSSPVISESTTPSETTTPTPAVTSISFTTSSTTSIPSVVLSTSSSTTVISPATSSASYTEIRSTTTLSPSPVTPSTTYIFSSSTGTPVSSSTSASASPSATSWAHSRAKELNHQYSEGKMNGKSTCFDGEISCSEDGKFAICNYGSWVYTECATGTTCYSYDFNDTVFTGCNFSYLKSNFV